MSFFLLSCSGWGAQTSVKEQELKIFFALKKSNTEEFVDFQILQFHDGNYWQKLR